MFGPAVMSVDGLRAREATLVCQMMGQRVDDNVAVFFTIRIWLVTLWGNMVVGGALLLISNKSPAGSN